MATQLLYTRGNQQQLILFDVATASHKFASEISPHPQEKGSLTSDNSTRKPQAISLNVVVTDYPISVAGGGTRPSTAPASQPGRAQAILNELRAIKDEGLACILQTTIGTFDNLRISDVTVQREQPLSGALKMSISLMETLIVQSQRVPLVTPVERKPQPKGDKGNKGTEKSSDPKTNKSVAKRLFNAVSGGAVQLFPDSFKKADDK